MSFFKIVVNIFVLAFVLLGVISCSKPKVSYHYPNNTEVDRRSKNTGRFMSGSWTPFAKSKEDKEGEKDAKEQPAQDVSRLWRTSVQVIGLLFPISIIDERSGIIATEWYQENETSNRRIKINVLIRNKEKLEDAIRVSVFEQQRNGSESPWQAASRDPKSVAKSANKAEQIKAEILRRMNKINEQK